MIVPLAKVLRSVSRARRIRNAFTAAAVLALTNCAGAPVADDRVAPVRTPLSSTPTHSSDLPASCHLAANGTMPDASCTPGALNTDVRPDPPVLGRTICRSGWTATVRPSRQESDQLKRQIFRRYGIAPTRDNLARYELDHRVPLEVGGAPRDPANLWPEPWEQDSQHPQGPAQSGTGAQSKDRIEDRVKASICGGRLTLQEGQQVFLGDWSQFR